MTISNEEHKEIQTFSNPFFENLTFSCKTHQLTQILLFNPLMVVLITPN
jgi:hypothetical protein